MRELKRGSDELVSNATDRTFSLRSRTLTTKGTDLVGRKAERKCRRKPCSGLGTRSWTPASWLVRGVAGREWWRSRRRCAGSGGVDVLGVVSVVSVDVGAVDVEGRLRETVI